MTESPDSLITKDQLIDILELAPDPIIVINQGNQISLLSKQAENLFGYQKNELAGKSFEMLIPERFRAGHKELCANYLKNPSVITMGHERMGVTCLRKDGSEFFAEIDLTSVKPSNMIDGEYLIISIIRDTTERKKAKEIIFLLLDIYKHISQAKTLNESLKIAITKVGATAGWDYAEVWVPDDKDIILQSSPIYFSTSKKLDKFRKISTKATFHRNEGLPGRVWASKKYEWIKDVSLKPQKIYLRSEIALEAGIKTGLGIPIISENKVIAVLVFYMFESRKEDVYLTDIVSAVVAQLGSIVQLKKSEGETRESEERFRSLAETAKDTIVVINKDSKILFVNSSVEQIFGYAKNKLTGNSLTMLMPKRFHQKHLDSISNHINTGKKHIAWKNIQIPGLHKEGFEIPLEISFSEFSLDNKSFFSGIIRDITEHKKTEEELRQKDKDIRKAYVDVFYAVTGGKLIIMTPDEIAEALGKPITIKHKVSKEVSLSKARIELKKTLMPLLPVEEIENTILALNEALTNAVKHAKGGQFQVYKKNSSIQILVKDNGPGIDFNVLPKATLLAGFSTKQTLGMGFSFMLEFCNRVLLSTRPGNTTLVLEVINKKFKD